MTPYKVSTEVCGDIVIALYLGARFLGNRLDMRPHLAFAFHTSFVEAETMRITPAQLDVSAPAIFGPSAAQAFFMDIVITDSRAVCPVQACKPLPAL